MMSPPQATITCVKIWRWKWMTGNQVTPTTWDRGPGVSSASRIGGTSTTHERSELGCERVEAAKNERSTEDDARDLPKEEHQRGLEEAWHLLGEEGVSARDASRPNAVGKANCECPSAAIGVDGDRVEWDASDEGAEDVAGGEGGQEVSQAASRGRLNESEAYPNS